MKVKHVNKFQFLKYARFCCGTTKMHVFLYVVWWPDILVWNRREQVQFLDAWLGSWEENTSQHISPHYNDVIMGAMASQVNSLTILDYETKQDHVVSKMLNSSPPGQNGRYFAEYIFKRVFLNETDRISVKCSLTFHKFPIYNKFGLVQVIVWRRTGVKGENMLLGYNAHTYWVSMLVLRIVHGLTPYRVHNATLMSVTGKRVKKSEKWKLEIL